MSRNILLTTTAITAVLLAQSASASPATTTMVVPPPDNRTCYYDPTTQDCEVTFHYGSTAIPILLGTARDQGECYDMCANAESPQADSPPVMPAM